MSESSHQSALGANSWGDENRCEAIAESTGERCQHDAVAPFPYCGDHMDLLDDVDLVRMGLKPSKSSG